MRPIAIVFLLALGLKAQIQELVSADDGSQLFFSTPFTLKGTTEANNSKIFQLAAGAYNPVTQNLGDFHFPNASGDGSVVAWDNYGCPGLVSICVNPSSIQGQLSGAQIPAQVSSNGSLRVSHNGRYFLSFLLTGATPTLYIYDSQTASTLTFAGYTEVGDGRVHRRRWKCGNGSLE
jgi:hypothetical protein